MIPPPSKGLRHIALKVHNMSSMKNFYVDVLGFHVEWEPDSDNLYLSSGMDNLALHRVDQSIEGGPLDHIGILVDVPERVDEWAEYLETQKVTLKTRPRTHRDGARSIYFNDPENNLIQLIYHPPISGR